MKRIILHSDELTVLIHACGCARFSDVFNKTELPTLDSIGEKLVTLEQADIEQPSDWMRAAAKEIEAWYGGPEWEHVFNLSPTERVMFCETILAGIIAKHFGVTV